MKLTNQQILELSSAIAALDGRQQVKVIDAKPVVATITYAFDGKTRWNLARNAGKLQSAVADYNRAKDALIRQHTGGKGNIPRDHENYAAFCTHIDQLHHAEVDIDLLKIDLASLKLDDNDVPIAVLNALSPIISA